MKNYVIEESTREEGYGFVFLPIMVGTVLRNVIR